MEKKIDEPKSIYTSDMVVITDDELYQVDLLNMDNKEFKKGVAYIYGDYFYTYKGEAKYDIGIAEPGIYKKNGKYILVEVTTEDDKEKYRVTDKISNTNTTNIIEMLRTNDDMLVVLPESNKIFLPELSHNDDILKRGIKQALIQKNIDIDQYKHRFTDKNALFNFKQVIKGDGKLSMLLFERGCNALNLKYTIIVEEMDPELSIGKRLEKGIIVSSEDTYDI